MIDNLPAYPAYRDSGLPWIGEIPAHWDILRNGRLFTHRVETGFPDLPILEVSLRTGVRVRDLVNLKRKQMMTQKEKYKRAVKGDIAYNMMRMWQGALGVAPTDGLISPAYVVVRPFDGVNSSYYDYLFRTGAYMSEVNKYSRGIVSDRNRLYWDEFKQMPSIIPPRDEQDKIVAFLRAQDRQIARFIRDKRRLIELLNEQKQTIIHCAVTRGLDPDVRLRPSGIEWLGDVPEHWEICRIKHVAMLNPSRSEIAEKRYTDELVTLLPMERVTVNGQLENPEQRKIEEVWEGYTYFKRGDVVMAKITPCFENGKGACLGNLPTECGFGTTEFMVLRPRSSAISGQFLYRLLSLKAFRRLGADAMTGAAGQQRVPLDFVKNFSIPLPPPQEQNALLEWLENSTLEQDEAMQRIKNEIDLIREYRERLISDVVTGKVDLRGWTQAPEDLEADDEELAMMEDDEDIPAEEDAGDAND